MVQQPSHRVVLERGIGPQDDRGQHRCHREPAIQSAATPPPDITTSITRRTTPGTATVAAPSRLGSPGTANPLHTATTATGKTSTNRHGA